MRILILFFLTLLCSTAFGQSSRFPEAEKQELDSLKTALKEAEQDSTRIRILNRLSELYGKSGQPRQAMSYAEKAKKRAVESGHLKGEGQALNNLAMIRMMGRKYSGAIELFKEVLAIRKELGMKEGVASIHNKLAICYHRSGALQKSIEHHEQSLDIRRTLGDSSDIAQTHNNIGILYARKGDLEQARESHRKSIRIRKKIGDRKGVATSFKLLGVLHRKKGRYEKALEMYRKSLEIRKEIGDPVGIASTYTSIGIVHKQQGRYDEAIEQYLKGLDIRDSLGDTNEISNSLENIGNVHLAQEHYEKGLEKYKRAEKMRRAIGDRNGLASLYQNMALAFEGLGRYEKALRSHRKSIRFKKELGKNRGVAQSYNNLGSLYLELYQKDSLPPFLKKPDRAPLEGSKKALLDSARFYYEAAAPFFRKRGMKKGLITALNGLGETHYHGGELEEALRSFQEAKEHADTVGLLPALYRSHKGLADAYKASGEHRRAMEHHEEFARIRDSVHSMESQEAIAKMEAKYEAEKRKRKIELMEEEEEKRRKLAQERSRRQWAIIYSVSGGFLAVLLLLFVLYNRFRIIRQQKGVIDRQKQAVDDAYQKLEATHGELQETHEHLQEKNKEISDSIDYASWIQEAVLPDPKELESCIGDHFILFRPQAKVSGDLYWCYSNGERSFWAAIDCTGHGVPGAFMSMIAQSLMDEVVIEKGIEDPGQVLDRMRKGVTEKLGDGDRKDGMDMALCCSERKGKKKLLHFAGANNPLYLIREGIAEAPPEVRFYREGREIEPKEPRCRPFSNSPDGFEIKGDKQAVGFEDQDPAPFTTASLELQEGDRIYTFSDGYADQFGGPKGKKFRYGPFKTSIASSSDRPMNEQKKILEEQFDEWKGDQEQIDDVIVIGVRV